MCLKDLRKNLHCVTTEHTARISVKFLECLFHCPGKTYPPGVSLPGHENTGQLSPGQKISFQISFLATEIMYCHQVLFLLFFSLIITIVQSLSNLLFESVENMILGSFLPGSERKT